jgi:hypothetical protein
MRVMDEEESKLLASEDHVIDSLRAELEKAEPSKRARILEKVFLAALSVIPWVGGVLSAAETYRTDEGSIRMNKIQTQWLVEHQKKIALLAHTLQEMGARLNGLGEEIDERIESEEYLALVRKAFRIWDESDTEEKRRLLSNVLTNAAGIRICSDDVLRIFLDWIRMYSEVHFAIMRGVYKNPGSTRYDIWVDMYGEETPREDSSQADLYRYLIRELSTGGVIRQPRNTNAAGEYLRKRPQRTPKGSAPVTMESTFEHTKPYVLTELGKEFVHYTMNEIVGRLSSESVTDAADAIPL